MEKLVLLRKPHLVIEPRSGWSALNLGEVWQFKDLLLVLAGRDIKLRYRQTALGALWILLGPLLSAGVFSFLFGRVAGLPSEGVAYFPFIYGGQLAWNVFNSTLGKTQTSLISNAHLVSKVYFPRLVLPLSSVFATLIDLGVGLGMAGVLMALYQITPHAGILLLPFWLALLLILALGIGLVTAALMVTYRDAGSFVGPFVSLLLYASPVFYAVSTIRDKMPALVPFYYLNPLAALIQGFRWSLLGTSAPPWGYVVYSTVFVIAVFLGGAFAFKRMERGFADVI